MADLYFIGAGPGDPCHLTLAGAAALQKAQVVFAPDPFEETFASVLEGKRVLVPFDYYFDDMITEIDRALESGDVAFLVPGDLTFYSPFQPFIDHYADRSHVLPGVGTANVLSAMLKKTLDLPGVCSRTIIASPRTLGDGGISFADLARPGVTLLIYMNNLPLTDLVAELRKGYGKDVPIVLGHRLCLPEEEIVAGSLDTIVDLVGDRDFFNLGKEIRRPALTLIVVGETLTAFGDSAWWDHRRRTLWQFRDRT